jgi:methionyl-tRNA synthetase
MKEKILITSALPYANGPLHFGHIAGAYLPGDCYARFQRLMQNDVLYVCGSDEYGVAITLSAELAGRTPKEHVDLYHHTNKELFKKLNFSFDHYSRTTWEGHRVPVHEYFLDLLQNGYIEARMTDQLFSEADNRFLADRYVIGTCPRCKYEHARGDECPKCGASYEATDLIQPRSKMTNSPLVLKKTKHWFLLLDKFKGGLSEWIDSKKDWKPNVINFVKHYVENLHPRAITRDSYWGVDIPLPDTEGKILYVWFEAPIGYISASKDWAIHAGKPDAWKDYWFDPKTKLVHFIGKDNIFFHAISFPAMTMGQNQPYKLVDELPANEFFNFEGRKFSKSEGWMIDLDDFFTRYTPDQIRYTIAANAPETSDAEFTWKDFQLRCNSELLGKYGNLVNRVLVFAQNNCEGKVPPMGALQPVDQEFLDQIQALAAQVKDAYQTFKLRRASQIIMELSQLGNIYFEKKRPWQDAKDPAKHAAMHTTIACCLEALKTLALISYPIIPATAGEVWKMLGNEGELTGFDAILAMRLPDRQKLETPKILFHKIEDEQIEEELRKLHAGAKHVEEKKMIFEPLKAPVDIADVQKIDMRIGTVLSAEPVPKSKKLLKLNVDLGFEQRTIVSGISLHYTPEELTGKKVIVIANLKSAKLMGVESHGMILAGSSDDALEVLTVEDLPGGSIVS